MPQHNRRRHCWRMRHPYTSGMGVRDALIYSMHPIVLIQPVGPHRMRASLCPAVSTYKQSAFTVGANRGAHTVR